MVYVFYGDCRKSDERPVLYSKCLDHLIGELEEKSKVVIIADTQWEADDYSYYFSHNYQGGETIKLGSEIEKRVGDKQMLFKIMTYEAFRESCPELRERYAVFTGSTCYEKIKELKSFSNAGEIYTIALSEEDLENHKKFFVEFESKNKNSEYYLSHPERIEKIRRNEEKRFIRIE